MSAHQATVIRAIDVGYGHVKFTDGRCPANALRCDQFPSQSPVARSKIFHDPVIRARDTHVVQVNDRAYEVGKAVAMATGSHQESEVLDHTFPLGDPYVARLYGALSYIAPTLKSAQLDYLVLGLPLTTYLLHAEALSNKFAGEHVVNTKGNRISIGECVVYPQPLGAYAAFWEEHPEFFEDRDPVTLVVDPGYNTVDWFVCQDMTANEQRSDATLCGMSAVLRAIAEKIIEDKQQGATVPEVVRRLDAALTGNREFTWCGKVLDLAPYMPAGDAIIDEAAQAIKNSVGSGVDIDVIVLGGGGARLYQRAISEKFPDHAVVLLSDPAFANVRGFHYIGERLSGSAARAAGQAS